MDHMPSAATMDLPYRDRNPELLLANLSYRLSCNRTGTLMSEESTSIANWLVHTVITTAEGTTREERNEQTG